MSATTKKQTCRQYFKSLGYRVFTTLDGFIIYPPPKKGNPDTIDYAKSDQMCRELEKLAFHDYEELFDGRCYYVYGNVDTKV